MWPGDGGPGTVAAQLSFGAANAEVLISRWRAIVPERRHLPYRRRHPRDQRLGAGEFWVCGQRAARVALEVMSTRESSRGVLRRTRTRYVQYDVQ